MPYRRSTFKRKRRRRYYKKKDTVKKVRRAVRKIQRAIETKTFIRYESSFTPSSTTPAPLTPQPVIGDQGPDVAGFIGVKYHAVGIKVAAVIKKNDLITAEVGNVRFVALWVKNIPSSGSTVWTTYFEETDDFAATIPPFLAPLRSSQAKNVKVLWDKKYSLGRCNAGSSFAAGTQQINISFYKSINSPVIMDEALGRKTRGALLIYTTTQYASAQTMIMNTKFYYKDP
jgi:hypothetical protein